MYLAINTIMKISEIESKRTPVSIPQGMATKKMYSTEKQIIEKIWGMKRPRSFKSIQAAFDLLWDHYSQEFNVRKPKPLVRFGPGTKYHGRYLSYTMPLKGGMQVIELAPGERNFYVLVHELAHALGPYQHGLRFAQIYHDLLSHETFKELMSTELGQQFLQFLKQEHPAYVRKAYRDR